MSDDPIFDADSDLTAAEFVLGLLPEQDMRALRVRTATDSDFAVAVAAWEEKLAALADEVRPVEPDGAVWDGIRAAVAASTSANDNAAPIGRSSNRLRIYAGAMTAVAASLAAMVGYQALQQPPVASPPVVAEAPQPTRLASLASEQEATALTVAFDPRGRMLTVVPGRLVSERGRARELWIIPTGGTPISLGVIGPGDRVQRQLPEGIARHFAAPATIAISVEPSGGSPTGQPTGPVVATGPLVIA